MFDFALNIRLLVMMKILVIIYIYIYIYIYNIRDISTDILTQNIGRPKFD